jgi:hypothetical protein
MSLELRTRIADVPTMPAITRTAKIEVRAPAEAAFAVVARDILAVKDDPDAMEGHRPLADGPLRKGFRWRQTVVHERKVCRSDWIVTELKPPWLLEQTMEHLCAVARRDVFGGERWELEVGSDGATVVTLRSWWHKPGLDGWLEKISGVVLGNWTNVSLKKRLAYVQFEAEKDFSGRGEGG